MVTEYSIILAKYPNITEKSTGLTTTATFIRSCTIAIPQRLHDIQQFIVLSRTWIICEHISHHSRRWSCTDWPGIFLNWMLINWRRLLQHSHLARQMFSNPKKNYVSYRMVGHSPPGIEYNDENMIAKCLYKTNHDTVLCRHPHPLTHPPSNTHIHKTHMIIGHENNAL